MDKLRRLARRVAAVCGTWWNQSILDITKAKIWMETHPGQSYPPMPRPIPPPPRPPPHPRSATTPREDVVAPPFVDGPSGLSDEDIDRIAQRVLRAIRLNRHHIAGQADRVVKGSA